MGLMLLITQMSYLCHYRQHAYNLNILASIIQLDLHFWPSRAPFIRREEWEQSATSCKGWPADWISQHCRINHDTGTQGTLWSCWIMAGLRQRMIGGGGSFQGRDRAMAFFLFEKEISPTFVPGKNEISIKTGDTGNLVSAWFLLLWLQGRAQESGVTRFRAKMRKKKNSFQGFLPLSP